MKQKMKCLIRKKFSIRLCFILLILLVLTGVSISSSLTSTLLYRYFKLPLEIPVSVSSLVVSIVLGTIVTGFLSKWILSPITKLSQAMHKVAQGDFSIRLESENMLNEIQGLYNNFNVMATELAATEVLQSDFVSNVSHEFKTPINAIEGYTMLLQENCSLSQEQTEYAEKILFNTKRLSGLVSNILLLSKIDNQTIPTKLECFRLDEQIRQAIVYLEPKWSEKEIEFDADLEECSFVGNEQLLLHIWLNLIDNAIKFNSRGGSVIIRLKLSEQNVLVSVQDTGPGIAMEEKKRVFDKFYQADSSHKNEGNGLGLALVKQVIAIHKGNIEVDNCTSGGCKFTVVLPIQS